MGMLFNSQAVLYLGARMNAEFAEIAIAPAKGLNYWKGTSAEAKEFRDALRASAQNTAPALGSITLEYFDILIPDSADGEGPSTGSDPSAGRGYKRWIIFWKDLRKKDKPTYKKLVKGVLDVLDGTVTGIKSITFSAIEDSAIDVTVKDTGTNRAIMLFTPKWHKVKNLPAVKKAAKKKR